MEEQTKLIGNSDSINLPLVSICCITYNHEKFISAAIEGFLNQKTKFHIEIIIHDDASTDMTAEIIRRFENQNPNLFHNIYQTENQYSKYGNRVLTNTFEVARGKYIAICEGDDYWTDPFKLQKQVDFLENNPDYEICYHNVELQFLDKKLPIDLREADPWDSYDLSDVIATSNFFRRKNATPGHTSSALFKREHVNFLKWYYHCNSGDIPLFIFLAGYGLSKYLHETMGVHNIHNNGVSQKKGGSFNF